jgi:hypothetical protein
MIASSAPATRGGWGPAAARPKKMARQLGVLGVVLGLVIYCLTVLRQDRPGPYPRILFGLGDEISAAVSAPLYRHGGVDMVTSWYNGPADLGWMSGYAQTNIISGLYQQGKALELVVWLADYPLYAVSSQFQSDLAKLITVFKGNGPYYGPLYVVLFTEFETYSSQPGYDLQLRSAYLTSVKTIHASDRQASVALGFGGYDWNAANPKRNLTFWQPAIAVSEFTAFQAMQDDASVGGNGQNIVVPEIEDAVRQLGSYGKPVMISHFELWGDPSGASQAFARVAGTLLKRSELNKLRSEGLFAWDFMGDDYVSDPGPGLSYAEAAVAQYSALPMDPTLFENHHAQT